MSRDVSKLMSPLPANLRVVRICSNGSSAHGMEQQSTIVLASAAPLGTYSPVAAFRHHVPGLSERTGQVQQRCFIQGQRMHADRTLELIREPGWVPVESDSVQASSPCRIPGCIKNLRHFTHSASPNALPVLSGTPGQQENAPENGTHTCDSNQEALDPEFRSRKKDLLAVKQLLDLERVALSAELQKSLAEQQTALILMKLEQTKSEVDEWRQVKMNMELENRLKQVRARRTKCSSGGRHDDRELDSSFLSLSPSFCIEKHSVY